MDRTLKKLLVIDNYDSFTYNLVQMFMQFSLSIHVFRSDRITLEEVEDFSPDYVLISPGPGTPSNTGISMPLLETSRPSITAYSFGWRRPTYS